MLFSMKDILIYKAHFMCHFYVDKFRVTQQSHKHILIFVLCLRCVNGYLKIQLLIIYLQFYFPLKILDAISRGLSVRKSDKRHELRFQYF